MAWVIQFIVHFVRKTCQPHTNILAMLVIHLILQIKQLAVSSGHQIHNDQRRRCFGYGGIGDDINVWYYNDKIRSRQY